MRIRLSKFVEHVHFFGQTAMVYKSDQFYKLFKSKIETDILHLIIEGNTIEDISNELKSKYKIKVESREEIDKVLIDFVNKNLDVFEIDNKVITNYKITGKKNYFFPSRIQIDITSFCNLFCPFCYKNSNENSNHLNIINLAQLLNFLNHGLYQIGLTGGEPTIHPQFIEIAKMCRKYCTRLEINTNGTLLHTIPREVLRLFDFYSISLYGLNDKEYYEKTGYLNGMTNLQRGCEILSSENIQYNISVLISPENIENIENYVKKAIELKANSIQFGVINGIGRAIKKKDYDLEINQTRLLYRAIRTLKRKYIQHIHVIEWEREIYLDTSEKNSFKDIYSNSPFICMAGTYQWSVNEKFEFKPCVIIPNEKNLSLTFSDWKRYVLNQKELNWISFSNNFYEFCNINEKNTNDFCTRLQLNELK